MQRRHPRDEGAAAIEFALLLPFLLVLVFGIIDFGRAFNAWIELSGAAREGARVLAVGGTVADANAAVAKNTTSLNPAATATFVPVGAACTAGSQVTAKVSYPFSWWTPLPALIPGLHSTFTITRTAVMPCGG